MISHKIGPLSLAQKKKILGSFPFFSKLKDREIEELAKRVRQVLIPQKEIFVEEDVDFDKAFFVYSGLVSIFRTTRDGELINLEVIGAPALVGEMGLVDSKESPASVMAINQTRALVLTQKDFSQIIAQNSQIASLILKLFADKIRYFDIFLEELLSKNLYQRTWRLIQYLGKHFPNGEIKLSQEELADLIWGSRSRITEVLNKLESEGKIKIGHRRVKLLYSLSEHPAKN